MKKKYRHRTVFFFSKMNIVQHRRKKLCRQFLRQYLTLQYFLYGIMAVLLGFGDAFHLVPRAVALCTTGLEQYTAALGIGKLITSVTMTLFYVLLYYVWRYRYEIEDRKEITMVVWVL